MKYLCLVYADEESNEDPARSRNGIMSALLEFEKELKQSGHALLFAPVHPSSTTTLKVSQRTVSIADPDRVVDQLCACLLLEARDLNEAIRVAGRMHGLCSSRIEVRPVLEHSTVAGL